MNKLTERSPSTIDGNLYLIKLVSQNRNIYDPHSKNYQDKLLKKTTWQYIARKLNLDGKFSFLGIPQLLYKLILLQKIS